MITLTFSVPENDPRLPLFYGALYSDQPVPSVPEPPMTSSPEPPAPKQLQIRVQPNIGASPVALKDIPGVSKTITGWLRESDGWRNVEREEHDPNKGDMVYVTASEGAGWTKLMNVESREV